MHSNTAHGAPNSKLNLRSISDGCNMFYKAKTINTLVYTQKRQKKAVSLYEIYCKFKRLQKIHLKTTVLRSITVMLMNHLILRLTKILLLLTTPRKKF